MPLDRNELAKLVGTSPEVTPRPPAPAFDIADCYGVVGEYVRLMAPHTEAAPVAVYATALAAIGALIGRGPSWRFGNEEHHPRLFVLLIGVSGAGRKGTAINVGVTDLLAAIDSDFEQHRKVSGLSSAEGLIAEVRDPTPPVIDDKGKVVIRGDDGVSDKRLCVVEGEIAGALEAMAREGNRLSAIVRDAWDGKSLRSMVKHDPQRATSPHIAIIGAITAAELRKLMTKTSVLNGLANRFLPIFATRARLLPDDSQPDPQALARVLGAIRGAVSRTRSIGAGRWSDEAAVLWRREYARLAINEDPSDIIRTLLERGAPYVRRLAFLFALLDGTATVAVPHLYAALALWQYGADTWRSVYHDGSIRSDLAEKLLAALIAAGPGGLTRTQIREEVVRSNDVAADRIDSALLELNGAGLAIRASAPTRGRPAQRWQHARYVGAQATEGREEREESAPSESDNASASDFTPFSPFAPTLPELIPDDHRVRGFGAAPAFDGPPLDSYDADEALMSLPSLEDLDNAA